MATIVRRFRLPPERAEQAEVFYQDTLQTIDRTLAVPVKGLAAYVQILAKHDPEIVKVKVEELIDLRIMTNLEKSGFIKSLYNR